MLTRMRVKPRPLGRGRKARSPSGLLWAPPINQQPYHEGHRDGVKEACDYVEKFAKAQKDRS